jgi:hypothetical protein
MALQPEATSLPVEHMKTAVIIQGLQVQDQIENEVIDVIPVKVCIFPINFYFHFFSLLEESCPTNGPPYFIHPPRGLRGVASVNSWLLHA